MKTKIMTQEAAARASARLRSRGKRIVFTNGCFDILHAGHIDYLERARRLGDALVVGLNSDSSVRRLKGPSRPLNPAADRARVLAALACVDLVTVFGDDTPARLITKIAPDVLVKGGDWKPADIVGSDTVLSRGGTVRSLPFLKGRSTTGLVRRIRSL